MTLDVGLEQIIALMVQTIPSEYWIVGLSSARTNAAGGLTKSGSNLYLAATADSDDLIGCSLQDSGILRSQFEATVSSYAQGGVAVGLDSSGNQYWLGSDHSINYPDTNAWLIKRNSAGVLQWELAFMAAKSAPNLVPLGMTVDSSGNCYIVGQAQGGAFVLKTSSAGAITWVKTLSAGSFCAVAVSGTDLYCAGHTVTGSPTSSSNAYLVKFSTTGALTWQRSLGGANKDVAFGVCVDTDGDVVIGGICDSGGTEGLLVAKYNSSGTQIYQRKIVTGGTFAAGGQVIPGASGTVYVVGTISDSVNKLLVAQIADAGTVAFQRKLNLTGAATAGRSVYRDADGLYVAGDLASSMLVAKLPDDGTLTGTHGDYTYAVSTQTDSSPGLTGATPTNTSSDAGTTQSITGVYSSGTLAAGRAAVS